MYLQRTLQSPISPLASRVRDCYCWSRVMVRACGFAEGEDRLFGVNRFPDSVGVKGGNVIRLSELKVIPLWVPVSEPVGKGTGGLSLLQSPAMRAAWLCCNMVC